MPRYWLFLGSCLLGLPDGSVAQPIASCEWLKGQIGRRDLVILEASWSQGKAAADYGAGHIPGAIHLDTDMLENGYPQWRLLSASALQAVIGRLGIGPRTTVVVYGAKTIAAARVWWVLHYAGVHDVWMLNGGYAAWLRAGYPGETRSNLPVARRFSAKVRDGALAATGYVREHGPKALLADVRSRDEFQGRVSGYDYLDRKGRIPGAVHFENADDSAAMYQNADGTLKPVDEIRRFWAKRGLVSDGKREVIFYCGSGWRSSLAYLYAVAMGFKRIRNYSDGWSGWSTIYTLVTDYQGTKAIWQQTSSGNPVAAGP